MREMKGKCYGCGSKEHTKKDRNHNRDTCHHCGKTGHKAPVCFAKYLGKPKAAGAAATTENNDAPSSSSSSPPSKQSASATTQSAKDNKNADLLAKMAAQIKMLEAETSALKSSF